jgi:hypothetical protein
VKDSFFIRLIVFTLLAIGLATGFTRLLYIWMYNDALRSGVPVTTVEILKTFGFCLVYFACLLVLPLFIRRIANRSHLSEKQFPFVLVALEILLFLFSFLAVPTSGETILLFISCQPVVLVNGISIYGGFEGIL